MRIKIFEGSGRKLFFVAAERPKNSRKMSEKPLEMDEPRKLHKPVLDHDGKPYSPAQLLVLERMELTRIRRMRDSMILAERRDEFNRDRCGQRILVEDMERIRY